MDNKNTIFGISVDKETGEVNLVPASGVPVTPVDCNYVKLTKNTKGYNWDIKVLETEDNDVLAKIKATDKQLREDYGGELKDAST